MTQKQQRPPVVWIVQNDIRKDFTPAEAYGTLAEIFYGTSDVAEPDKLVEHARRSMRNWEPGDYLLMVGDPSLLCALLGHSFRVRPHRTGNAAPLGQDQTGVFGATVRF